MRIVCITLGLLIVSFSAAVGDDFVNFAPRDQSPFFPSKGLLFGDSYVNRNDDSNSYLKSNNSSEVVESYLGERARQVIIARGRYVRVTYRKDNGESETVEWFVQAIDETELTIYQGGLRKRIARERIETLMVCDHSRQLQEARRILAKGEQSPEKNQSVFPTAVIGEVDQYVGENARKVVVAKGRYVGLIYRRDDGKIEKAEGFVRAMNETELTIQHPFRVGRRIISREKITVLMVCDYPSQLQRAPFF